MADDSAELAKTDTMVPQFLLEGPPITPLERRLESFFGNLAGLSPRDWLGEFEYAGQLGLIGPEAEESPIFAEKLVQRAFAFMASDRGRAAYYFSSPDFPEDASEDERAYRGLAFEVDRMGFFDFLRGVVQVASQADKKTTQTAVVALMGKEPVMHTLADFACSFPEMGVEDQEVVTNASGESQIEYWGRTIIIKPPLEEGARAREAMRGFAVLIEDKNGRPLSLARLNILSAADGGETEAEACSAEEFTQRYYYGEPTSLEAVQATLDDSLFRQNLVDLLGREIDPAVLPLYARARLKEVCDDPRMRGRVERLFRTLGQDCLCLFQVLEGEDLEKAIEAGERLVVKGAGHLARNLIAGAFRVQEYAVELAGEGGLLDIPITRLVERKSIDQIKEAIELITSSPETLTDYDLGMVAYPQLAIIAVCEAADALKKGKALPFRTELAMPSRFVLDLFDFSGRHPEGKTTFQLLFDLAIAVQIAKQRLAPYAGRIREMKTDFYEAYNHDNLMGKEVATTSNIDVVRAASLIDFERKEGRLPEKPRALFLGCGSCHRFELPVIARLRELGIELDEAIGVDLIDFSGEIPSENGSGVRFIQADIAQAGFLEQEGEFDVVFVPWSMINDLVEKEGLLMALQRVRRSVKMNGVAIVDLPLPIGGNSYADKIEEQADLWGIWGIMERDFEHGEVRLRSIFDIMHLREFFMHMIHSEFLPTSPRFPLELDQQQGLCEAIAQDDSGLTRNHEQGVDHDAVEHPLWQAKGYNRVTLALRRTDFEEIQKKTGLMASLLVSRAFASLEKKD